MTETARPVVVVAGMHRGGTSVVARVLGLLGAELGPDADLLAPGADNPSGYWEDREVTELHDRTLAQLGGSWDRPPVLTSGWAAADGLAEARRSVSSVLARLRAQPGTGPVAVKDPRLCLLLPMWAEADPDLTVVVVARDPAEVAASLARRNGFTVEHASALWLRYTLAASAAAPGHLLVRYDDFFGDPDGVIAALADHCGLAEPGSRALVAVNDYLDPRLRHHEMTEFEGAARAEESPFAAMAARVWNGGELDPGALDPDLVVGLAQGQVAPASTEVDLQRARAEAAELTAQIQRRNRDRDGRLSWRIRLAWRSARRSAGRRPGGAE